MQFSLLIVEMQAIENAKNISHLPLGMVIILIILIDRHLTIICDRLFGG